MKGAKYHVTKSLFVLSFQFLLIYVAALQIEKDRSGEMRIRLENTHSDLSHETTNLLQLSIVKMLMFDGTAGRGPL